jgi:hypothetical protein
MLASTLRRLLAATAAAAIITAITPVLPDRFDAANPFDASSASARNGGDDSGSGGGDDGGSGGGNSGPGGGDDSGHGGDDGSGDNSGPGGDDHGGDNRGAGGGGDRDGGDDDDGNDDDFGGRDGHHIDGATGARIEVEGGNIEIVYPDGWKEELENGIFELKDPSGRTVIERRATSEDIARLRAIVN